MNKKLSKLYTITKQWFGLYVPLLLPFLEKKPNTWRAKRYEKKIRNHYVSITFRRFHTNPAKRTTKLKQLSIGVRFFGIREICLAYKKFTSRRKKRTFRHTLGHILLIRPRLDFGFTLIFVGVIGVGYFGLQMSKLYASRPPAPSIVSVSLPPPPEKPIALPASNPNRVVIESIGVNAPIVPVGTLANGELETPDVFSTDVGWYKKGPTPGEIGPAVLVGHVDTIRGPSVFWKLATITPGSDIKVTRADGTTAIFKVNAVEQYDQNNFPTNKVYGATSHSSLRVITCGGTFNYLKNRYTQNTVVYADLIN